jgi:hypothetical protein
MTLQTVILVNAILDLGIVLALAAVMAVPCTLDRRRDVASIHAFAAPLRDDLAA